MTRLDKQVWIETRDGGQPAPGSQVRFTAHWLTGLRSTANTAHPNVHAAPLVGYPHRVKGAFEKSGDTVRFVADDPAGYAAFLTACAAWGAPVPDPELEGADRG